MGVVVPLPVAKPAETSRSKPTKIAFTENRIAALKRPSEGASYVYDMVEAGLCVCLTPSAATYVFYRWLNGRPGRIRIGKVGELALRDARQKVAALRGDIARGVDVFAEYRATKHPERAATLTDAYTALTSRPDMRPSTKRDYASLWKRVPARMQSMALVEISQGAINKLHAEVGKKHARTANKLVALLSVLFTSNGRRADNPAAGIKRFREEPRQRVLSVDELQRLRTALDAEPEPWRGFFLVAMLTGARRGALARMRWDDLDLEAAVWRVPAVWSKNRKVLTVALAREAVEVLTTLARTKGTSPWVFPANSAAGHISEPIKAWNRIAKRAGVVNAKPHDLRRTLGTAVAADGAGAAMISAVLGHMSQQSARSYVHLSAEMAREAVEKAAARSRKAIATPDKGAP